jgi:hypothetical protein
MTETRMIQVVYGFLPERISRRQSERFILAHNASQDKPLPIPQPPVSRFWCRRAPDGNAPENAWMIGWTCPAVVRDKSPLECIAPDIARLAEAVAL